jgi:hypothetical protein
MSLTSADEIRQYLILQKKTIQDLVVLCEGLDLDTQGTKQELIKRLIELKTISQLSPFVPQLIALRTKFDGKPIPGAFALLERVRKAIEAKPDNLKEFSVLNALGQSYTQYFRFLNITHCSLKTLIQSNMFYPIEAQRDLVTRVKTDPDKFLFHWVNKTFGDRSFIMLHCQPK